MGKQVCQGKIERDGFEWYCLRCGYSSTSWNTEHIPLQTKAQHLADCALTVLSEERR